MLKIRRLRQVKTVFKVQNVNRRIESRIARRRLLIFASILLPCLLIVSPLCAQTNSTIEGSVSDPQSLPIPSAQIKVNNPLIAVERTAITDNAGFYRFPALPPGKYTVTVSRNDFLSKQFEVELSLNRTFISDIILELKQIREEVTVTRNDELPDPASSASATMISLREITKMPLNGRNYLDLMQLVPGVAVNRQADPGADAAVSVLGEKGGNTLYLIEGLSNQDAFNGGAAAQFNQDTIAEFQVLTTGYKAEFGRGSGGVVNVVTKGGTNDWRGSFSLFHRNDALDASNVSERDAPFLRRWDSTISLGGPVVKDKIFFFGSAERISERRQLNFVFPQNTPQRLREVEGSFDNPTRDSETRLFARLDEQAGRHRITQLINYTSRRLLDYLPLSQATNLPSTRQDFDSRRLMLGITDTVLLGNQSTPFVATLRGQYRREPSSVQPSHPEAGHSTQLELFSSLTTNRFFGDLGQVTFGAPFTPSNLNQKYVSAGADFARYFARHDLKFGGNFNHTRVDGIEANLLFNLLFATLDDFHRFGQVNSGLFTFRTRGGTNPDDNRIRLRNNYTGLFIQDDWRIRKDLTLNFGMRWDHDSAFSSKGNLSPRLGVAWQIAPRTVARASWGVFYDQIRLGQVRDIPAFGGANITNIQPVSYPRLFYGVPTILPIVLGLCLSPVLTDAQVAASGAACRFGPLPLVGVDRLNRVVAPGYAPIPSNVVVTIENVQALTGLTPQQFVNQAGAAVERPPGYFFWGPLGTLSQIGSATTAFPVTLDPSFRTPHTRSFNIGVQSEIYRGISIGAEFFHKDIRDIAGVRLTNIPLAARLPGNERRFDPPSPNQEIRGFGPWFSGTYNALSLTFNTRFSSRFSLAGNYTYTRAVDNLRCPNLTTGLSLCVPSDSFKGVAPPVTESATGRTNANGPFTASNGNPVPQAGVFYNGPDLDRGSSDLSPDHAFSIYGIAELPWQLSVSGIFRAQSGFHFSRQAAIPIDVDGDQNYNNIDHTAVRNAFTAPPFMNLDLRFSKHWRIGEQVKMTALFEFFNVLNRRNPAAVETAEGRPVPFGKPLQVLPGREGQIGLRIEF